MTRPARPAAALAVRRGLLVLLAGATVALAGCARVRLQVGAERDGGLLDAGPVDLDAGIDPLHVASIALGSDHACAVLVDGRVACWGADDHGQLALQRELMLRPERCGERFCATRPSASFLLQDVVDVVAGDGFSCARTARGEVSCWGSHRVGELGDGERSDFELHSQPRPVSGDVLEITAGRHHACLRDAAGRVSCWGLGAHGQLGAAAPETCRVPDGRAAELGLPDGTTSVPCSTRPVGVEGLGGPVDRIAAGDHHTCALQSGRVLCWGRDHRGQLGDAAPGDDRATPRDVGASGVVELALGGDASVALVPGGALAWGDASRGQLLVAATAECGGAPCVVAPVDVRAPAITALGRDHACGIDAGGSAACWGLAADGRLGTGAPPPDACAEGPCAIEPVRLDLPPGVRAIAVGDGHACALVFGGEASASVRCWGRNDAGQAGTGRFGDPEPVPAEVLGTR